MSDRHRETPHGDSTERQPRGEEGGGVNDRTEWAAGYMVEKADRWYYAEREICGFGAHTEPPCVKSPGHDGDHDGTHQALWVERFTAWIDHQRAIGREEMSRDAAEEAGQ